jgi:predicted transglutaminase-like cysteine proteinase
LRDDAGMGRGCDIRLPVLVAVLLLLAPLAAEARYRFEDGVYLGPARLLSDWADTLARAEAEAPVLTACLADRTACPSRLRGVHALVARARELTRQRQLRLINRYVNKRRYRGDRSAEVVSTVAEASVRLRSRWSTLTEFMRRGGDCEDYATSKYQLLRALGIPAEDLRVVVVYDRTVREHHAVLAARLEDGSAWLLDSDDTIHRGRPFGYRFVYALNETSIWDHQRDARTGAALVNAEETS